MSDDWKGLSPRVALCLSNLPTIREVVQVLSEECERELRLFLRHVRQTIERDIPVLKEWSVYLEDDRIIAHPGRCWELADSSHIAVEAHFKGRMKPLNGQRPYLGLRLPDFPARNEFVERLRQALPGTFWEEWDRPEQGWPIWRYVKLDDYAKGGEFDISSLHGAVVKGVNDIVSNEEAITRCLGQVGV